MFIALTLQTERQNELHVITQLDQNDTLDFTVGLFFMCSVSIGSDLFPSSDHIPISTRPHGVSFHTA